MPSRVQTDRFEAQCCQTSFYEFFRSFWPLVAAEKLVESWYIRKYCDELQVLSERVFADLPKEHDLIINCPPGTTKSTVMSIMWQPWLWTRMPSCRVITGSYSEKLALDFSRKSRDIVLSDKYQRLFPFIKLREDQNTKAYFTNTRGGMRYAVGVGGSVIGIHGHIIAVDDPIDPLGALSDLILAESNSWMTETLSRRKVNVMLTPTALIMQRLHQDDPSGNLLRRGTPVRHICLPGDSSWEIKPPQLKEFYSEDGLFDPIRIPRPALDEALITLGEVGYAGQFGQQPVPRGGAMFKVDRLFYVHPASIPKLWKRGPLRYWDKAATRGGGAFTAGDKMGLDLEDRIWIMDVVRGQWDSGTREQRIVFTAKLDGKHCKQWVEQEPGSGGKESAEATVKRLVLAGLRAGMHKPSGDKELRADPLSEYVNLGKVVIVTGPWNQAFIEEMRFFPRSTYKDQIDAASGGFSNLVGKRVRIGVL